MGDDLSPREVVVFAATAAAPRPLDKLIGQHIRGNQGAYGIVAEAMLQKASGVEEAAALLRLCVYEELRAGPKAH